MKTSLLMRLVITVLGATLLVYSLAVLVLYAYLEHTAHQNLNQSLTRQFELVKGLLEEEDEGQRIELELSQVKTGDLANLYSGRYYVVLVQGQAPILSDSLGGRLPAFVEQLRRTPDPVFTELSGPRAEPLRLLSQHIQFSQRDVQVIVAESLLPAYQWLKTVRSALFLGFPLVALFLFLLLWGVTHWMLRPLKTLIQDIQSFDVHSQAALPPLLSDRVEDIDQLHRAFNGLLVRFQKVREAEAQLLIDVSHQIKTPLTVILSTCDVILQRSREATTYQSALTQIRDTGKGLRSLLTRLLSSAHVSSEQQQQLHREPIVFEDVVAQAVTLMQPMAQQYAIALRFSPSTRHSLNADAHKLTELLLILLENALYYSTPQTHVSIQTHGTAEHLVLTVQDQGPGISAEDAPHLFTRFYRGAQSEKHSGSGLGLSLAQRIAQLHQGTLSLDTTVKTGACFVLRLPLS